MGNMPVIGGDRFGPGIVVICGIAGTASKAVKVNKFEFRNQSYTRVILAGRKYVG